MYNNAYYICKCSLHAKIHLLHILMVYFIDVHIKYVLTVQLHFYAKYQCRRQIGNSNKSTEKDSFLTFSNKEFCSPLQFFQIRKWEFFLPLFFSLPNSFFVVIILSRRKTRTYLKSYRLEKPKLNVFNTSRVTGLGEFSPVGRLSTLGRFF
jgi:hypothetical protein